MQQAIAAENSSDKIQAAQAYEEVAKIWRQAWQEQEPAYHPELKQFYKEQADKYAEKAKTLRQTSSFSAENGNSESTEIELYVTVKKSHT